MRWERLFEDLEARFDAAERSEIEAEAAELTRAERSTVALADRVRAASGPVVVDLVGGTRVAGAVAAASGGWVLIADGPRRHLVPLTAVAALGGLGRRVAAPAGAVERRLGLGQVLRELSRNRVVVRVTHRSGQVAGRVDGVGADHLEVAAVRPDDVRPSGDRVVIPFAAIEVISSG